jgi:glycine/D-amino acid oxidase-like deaminating enzyme
MTASDKDFPTDRHGWAELLPPRQPPPPLQGDHRVPWAVIGAGLTGLACARRLAALFPDSEILLLDARQVGQGASGRNSGFAVAVSHFPGGFVMSERGNYARVNRINQAGLDLLRGWVQEHDISCQWVEGGIHHGAADHWSLAECSHFRRYLDEMHIANTHLEADAMAGRLGTPHYNAGIHVHQGALLQPAALVHGLADSLPANVRLCEQSAVLALETGTPVRLRLRQARVQADNVVLATNYEAGKLGFLRRRLAATTLSGSFTRQLSGDERASLGTLEQWGLLSLHGGGATVRLTLDERLCLRNTAEFHGSRLLSEGQLAQRQTQHRAAFEARFPGLAHVPFEFAWSGVEGISRNGTNFFGRQDDHVYFAGGYNGSGVSRGTAFGTALAEYAAGGQSSLIEDCLASAPGSWIPPRPFLDMAAALMVRARFKNVGRDR